MNSAIKEMRPLRSVQGYREIRFKNLDKIGAVAYVKEEGNRFYWKTFTRKSMKPQLNYYGIDRDRMHQSISNWATNLESREAEKIARREANKGGTAEINLGDVFYTSWGYDQTNVDFFQVVGYKGKTMLKLRKIAKEQVTESKVRAVKDTFTSDEILEKRYNPKYKSVKISSVETGWLDTDGATHYETPWGMGH